MRIGLIFRGFRRTFFLIGFLVISLSFQGCASDSILGGFIRMFTARHARSLGPDPNLHNQGFGDDAGVAGEAKEAGVDAQDQIIDQHESEDPLSALEGERADSNNSELGFGK